MIVKTFSKRQEIRHDKNQTTVKMSTFRDCGTTRSNTTSSLIFDQNASVVKSKIMKNLNTPHCYAPRNRELTTNEQVNGKYVARES